MVVNGARDARSNGSQLSDAIRYTRGSAEFPMTILVEPGVYELAAGELVLDDHVSLVGSGRGVTSVIIDSYDGMEVGPGSTIADLTIENVQDSPTTGSRVMSLIRADGAVLRDLEIVSEFDSGLHVGSSADVLLDGVEIDTGETGLQVQSLPGTNPPSIVTVLGSTITSDRAAIWGVNGGNLVTVRDTTLTSKIDTINAYQGGRVVIEHSTIVATAGAWARVHTNINTETVYEVAHTRIESTQSFNATGLLTAPRCLAITTKTTFTSTCP